MSPFTVKRPISFKDAKRFYPYRYTMEHVPFWAATKCAGRYYAPQYRSDREWYDNALFPGEGDIGEFEGHCQSRNETWPLGQWLDEPYKVPT